MVGGIATVLKGEAAALAAMMLYGGVEAAVQAHQGTT